MKDNTNEQIKQVTNALLRDAEEAYRDGDEVAFFKSLERMKVGAEALALLAQVAEYTKEAKGHSNV
jgi:hypothetical protein